MARKVSSKKTSQKTMNRLLPLLTAASLALASCASTPPDITQADVNGDGVISPTEDAQFKKQQGVAPSKTGVAPVTQGIRDTATTVGLVRNIQAILRGF
jgi:hypothetical protein